MVRAVLLAMSTVECDREDAARGRGVALGCQVPGGLAFLDAALVLLRVRLVDAVTSGLDEPIPYALTPAGLAAVGGPP